MNNQMKTIFASVLMLVLLLTQSVPIRAEEGLDQARSQIIATTPASITFAVSFPVDELVLEEIQADGKEFTTVELAGFANTSVEGAPQLPVFTEVLGVPFDSEVKLTITPGRERTIKIDAPVVPVITEKIEPSLSQLAAGEWSDVATQYLTVTDPRFYKSAEVYPATLGEISNDAILRSQRLVSISLHPVRYNVAKNELSLVESLTVGVEFVGSIAESQAGEYLEAAVYEDLFENNLLNYEQAKTWRQDPTSQPVISQTLWSPPDPGWRIKVRETGMHKLTFSELQAAGIPVETIDLATIKMFHLGEEMAISVVPGEGVTFYGEAIESKYTADNIYWLTYGGNAGLRMQTIDGTPGTASAPESHLTVEHYEQDKWNRSLVEGGDDFERYFWIDVQRNKEWNYQFLLDHRHHGDLTLRVNLAGYIQEIEVNPDHRAGIFINGTQVGDVSWDGFATMQTEMTVPAALLLNGANTITIRALTTAHTFDMFFIDWFEIEYERNFASESGRLDFSFDTTGARKFTISGFNTNQVNIFDVTDPLLVKKIDHVQVNPEGSNFSAVFENTITAPRGFAALESNVYLSVFDFERDTPSNLGAASNGADYLMIAHAAFLETAEDLQTQKTAQGLRTELIDVQDIYDQFGYGIVDIHAIRGFIAYAYSNWAAPAPSYVLMIGDGHFDPKNNEGYGRTSFIPPFLAFSDIKMGETASDNRYVAIVGNDSMPDLMLGRLSVNTTAEAEAFISKIIAYENDPPAGDWKQQVLAITDRPEVGAHYPNISDSLLRDYLPTEPYGVEKVYFKWTHMDLEEARAAIIAGFNSGKFLVNYIGHAGYNLWGNDNLFEIRNILTLDPQDKLPIVVTMTCLEGTYTSPRPYAANYQGGVYEAVGEVITRTEGRGAVASWSPTGWGKVAGHDFLDRGFFKAIYQDGAYLVGQAVNSGLLNLWATGKDLDLLDNYLLFGDPAMRMQLSLTAVRDQYVVNEDNVLNVPVGQGVLSNDINPGNKPLTAILVDDVYEGSLALSEDGSFVYTPAPDYHGVDSFSYRIFDGNNYSNTVSVQIRINPVNDPPFAHDKFVVTGINTPVDIELTATDDGDGGSSLRNGLTFEVLTQPTQGMLSGEAPYLIYTPNHDYTGDDIFTFKANDGEYDSNIAIVKIMIGQQLFLPLIWR